MVIDVDVEAEIEQIHTVIERWLAGKDPEGDQSFDRLQSALAFDFRLVNPIGIELDRQMLIDRLRQARGERPGIRIWAEHLEVICNRLDETDQTAFNSEPDPRAALRFAYLSRMNPI